MRYEVMDTRTPLVGSIDLPLRSGSTPVRAASRTTHRRWGSGHDGARNSIEGRQAAGRRDGMIHRHMRAWGYDVLQVLIFITVFVWMVLHGT